MNNIFKCLYQLTTIVVFLTIPFFATAQSISGVINSYYKVLAIDLAQNKIKLDNITGLNYNDRILIIQMKGASINSSNSSSFGNISTIGYAGNYEFASICGFSNDTILLQANLVNSYSAAGALQVVKVATYTNVTVSDTVKAQAWNASSGTGGVIVVEASGTVTLNSVISASGKGFAGGTYNVSSGDCSNTFVSTDYYYSTYSVSSLFPLYGAAKGEGIADFLTGKYYGKGKQENGGGGGNNHDAGGAGGANYGAGGNGGNQTGLGCVGLNPGIGGASLSSFGYGTVTNKIFLGGGGGSGENDSNEGIAGGNGGGIIIIKANTISGNAHTIEANGIQQYNANNTANIYEANGDGGGGGGAGGVVVLDVTNYNGNITTEVKGANGNNSGFSTACTGPGGGGGGGVIWLSKNSLPANVTTSTSGGSNGVVKVAACLNSANGATSGGNGITLFNHQSPEGSGVSCSVLPIYTDLHFTSHIVNQSIILEWTYPAAETLKQVVLEKSYNGRNYYPVKSYVSNASGESFPDVANAVRLFYRLRVTTFSNQIFYTPVLSLSFVIHEEYKIVTNPIGQTLIVQVMNNKRQLLHLNFYDINGKLHWTKNITVTEGQQLLSVQIPLLPAGVYFVSIITSDGVTVKKIIKQ